MLGQDLVNRKDPKTITSQISEENPVAMTLSPETFGFGFGLQHPTTYAHYIDESIYTVKVTLDQQIRTINDDGSLDLKWKSTPLEMERCTKEHFGTIGPKFANLELNSLYCLKPNQTKLEQVRIQGMFESPLYEAFTAMIKQCDNKTSKVPCAPKETLNELLGGAWFAPYFTNLAIELKNYSFPNVGYRDSFYTSMSNSYYKEVTLWLSHVEVTSNFGWVTKDVKEEKFIRMDHTQEYFSFIPDANHMMNFLFRVDKIKTHYERSYIKVQNIFSQINGFISVGLIVGFIILMPYSKIKFYERLINELFDVKILEQNKKGDKKLTRRRTNKTLTRIIVDGDKPDNIESEEKDNGIDPLFEKTASKLTSSPGSPSPKREVSKHNKNKHQRKNSSPFNSPKNNSFLERNYFSISSDIKDMRFIKIDTSPNFQTQDVKHGEEKKLADANPTSISLKLPTYTCYLLPDKPQKSDHPRGTLSDAFEVPSLGEGFANTENMIEKQEAKLSNEDSGSAEEKNNTPIKTKEGLKHKERAKNIMRLKKRFWKGQKNQRFTFTIQFVLQFYSEKYTQKYGKESISTAES